MLQDSSLLFSPRALLSPCWPEQGSNSFCTEGRGLAEAEAEGDAGL